MKHAYSYTSDDIASLIRSIDFHLRRTVDVKYFDQEEEYLLSCILLWPSMGRRSSAALELAARCAKARELLQELEFYATNAVIREDANLLPIIQPSVLPFR